MTLMPLSNRTMDSLSFIASVCLWQPNEVHCNSSVAPASVVVDENASSLDAVTASQVSFSLQDIGPLYQDPNSIFADHHYEDDMSWINTRPAFLNGTMVVPLLLLAFMVVSAILLTVLIGDDNRQKSRKVEPLLPQQHSSVSLSLPAKRISLSRRSFVVLETIPEHEP